MTRTGAERADLIVVGAGLAGAASAWAATSRGLSVAVLEAFGPGHRRGSSHGSARIFRRAYPDPLYIRLTGLAREGWLRLEDEGGERLLCVTGGLNFGCRNETERMHALLVAAGVPAELLRDDEAAERWPGISFSGTGPVMFHPGAGVLDPDRAVAVTLRLAAGRGAAVLHDTRVTRVEAAPGGNGAVVHTAAGMFTAPAVVVAAGAWLGPLMGELVPIPALTVTQQQVFHFAPRVGPDPGRAPWPTLVYLDDTYNVYGLPGGRDGGVPGAVKVAEHNNGTVTTAAGRASVVDPRSRQRVTAFVAERLPGLDGKPGNESTCLYTSTANEDFILDRHGPFVITSACSGHGAKFAPLVGEIATDLATGKTPPVSRFTLAAHLRSG